MYMNIKQLAQDAALKLKLYLAKLDPEKFVRVHKSAIVSRDHIKRKTFAGVVLSNEKEIAIGRQFKDRI